MGQRLEVLAKGVLTICILLNTKIGVNLSHAPPCQILSFLWIMTWVSTLLVHPTTMIQTIMLSHDSNPFPLKSSFYMSCFASCILIPSEQCHKHIVTWVWPVSFPSFGNLPVSTSVDTFPSPESIVYFYVAMHSMFIMFMPCHAFHVTCT